jgi:hypothetical protein
VGPPCFFCVPCGCLFYFFVVLTPGLAAPALTAPLTGTPDSPRMQPTPTVFTEEQTTWGRVMGHQLHS